MSNSVVIIDMKQFRHNKMVNDITKQYIAYYGNTPKEVVPSKPKLKLVSEYTADDIAQLQGNTDMDSYMEWLSTEGINTADITIIKPDPKVPY